MLVYLADQIAELCVTASRHHAKKRSNVRGGGIGSLVNVSEDRVKCLLLQDAGLVFAYDRHQRIQAQFMEMFAHKLVAEAVQGANERVVEQHQLLGKERITCSLVAR